MSEFSSSGSSHLILSMLATGNGTLDKQEISEAMRAMGRTEAAIEKAVSAMSSDEIGLAVRWPLKGGHNRKKRPKTSSQGKILCTRVRKMKRSTEVCWAHYPRSFGVAPFIFRTHLQHASSFLSEIVLFARVEPRS